MSATHNNNGAKALRQSFYDFRNSQGFGKIMPAVKGTVHGIFAGIEAVSSPIMDHIVPNMKWGVFSALAKDLHSRPDFGNLSKFQRVEQLTQAWDSVENRMGQMTYDNLFWNQYLKDAAQLAVRSVGWNLGSIREFGGAGTDLLNRKKRMARGGEAMSGKQAYTIGCAITYASTGALVGYLYGQPPKSLKDLVFPRTGQQNSDGSDERISLPNYSKDVASYALHPWRTLTHKIHPMWGTLNEVMFLNEDFYGTEIRNANDPWMTQLIDSVKHVGEGFLPISSKNFQRMREAEEPTAKALLMAGSGLTSAPAYITQSPALQLANKYLKEQIPQRSRTKDETEEQTNKKKFTQEIRKGTGTEDKYGDKLKKASSIKSGAKAAAYTPLEDKVRRLSLEQGINVLLSAQNSGDKEEIQQIKDTLTKMRAGRKDVDEETDNELAKALAK